jgi:hypothetical protein
MNQFNHPANRTMNDQKRHSGQNQTFQLAKVQLSQSSAFPKFNFSTANFQAIVNGHP